MTALLEFEQFYRASNKTSRVCKGFGVEGDPVIFVLVPLVRYQKKDEGSRSIPMGRFGDSFRILLPHRMTQNHEIELPLGDEFQRCDSRGAQHVRARLS